MAIALVQSATGISTTATTTATFSVAPTSGNLIVLGFSGDDYNGTPDSGWTQSTGMEQQTFHGGYVWWRISTGANSFPYTIGSANRTTWVLAEFSGVHATPYDISNGTFTQSSGASQATPTIIPTTGNRLLVAMIGGNDNNTLATVTQSWTNSFTNIAIIGSNAASLCTGLAYRLVTGDSATGYTSTCTLAGLTNTVARSGLIISFKEAAGGTAYTLAAAAGSYAMTGVAATPKHGWKPAAAAGSYGMTGTAATLTYSGAAGSRSLPPRNPTAFLPFLVR